jgi:hypothetical protein
MTLDQQEPSANSPCTKTTFFVFGDVWALATRLSRGTVALAAATPIFRNGQPAPQCRRLDPPHARWGSFLAQLDPNDRQCDVTA